MAVKPQTVNHQERDLNLADRESGNGHGEELALKTMRDRIAAAKAAVPTDAERKYLCCLACFNRGRDAAVRIIEGAERP